MIDKYPYFKSKLVTRQINKKGFDGLGNILEEYSRPRTQKKTITHIVIQIVTQPVKTQKNKKNMKLKQKKLLKLIKESTI